MPAGRPTDYEPDYCEQVIEMGKIGMSLVEMAATLGVAKSTLTDLWPVAHPEFKAALTHAKECSQCWWESMGRVNLIMAPQSGTFQASVWSRSMAARFPADWREKSETTLQGVDGAPIKTESTVVLTSEEAYKKMLGG